MTDPFISPAAAPPSLALSAATPAHLFGTRPDAAAARQFEAMMLTQMMQSMFSGVSTDGAFGGGFAEETFRGLLLEAVGSQIAAGRGLGIAEHVQAQIAAYKAGSEG